MCLWLLTENTWLGKSQENEGYDSTTFHVEKKIIIFFTYLSFLNENHNFQGEEGWWRYIYYIYNLSAILNHTIKQTL